jgi:hypothetical protein
MMCDRKKGLNVMNQALPNDYCQTYRPHAAATGEIGGGPVSSDAACALLRWENEGGSALLSQSLPFAKRPLVGTTSQIEWAEGIRTRVNDEFDRVAKSFRSIAQRQDARKRSDTEAILAILDDKRAEVLSRDRAGYFIHDWQEISDQVRQMIGEDPRYQAIQAGKAAAKILNGDK